MWRIRLRHLDILYQHPFLYYPNGSSFSARWDQRFIFDPKYLCNLWEFREIFFSVNRQCGYEKLLGMVILGVGEVVPLPQDFFVKKCYFPLFFVHFSTIPRHKTIKIWESVPPPLGAPSPLKCFRILNSGWLGAYTCTFPRLDLSRFGL